MLRKILAGLGLAALAACGGSTEPTVVYGTYTLQTINGAKLPGVIFASNSGTISVTSASLTFRADHTFSWPRMQHDVSSSGTEDIQTSADGTFTQSGNDLSLVYQSSRTYSGTWSGNTVTVTVPAVNPGDITATYMFTR